ncbi:MAG: hypothetical protein V3U13_08900 [Gemmatimonadota bacterium]|jgi:ABC-type transport system involved in multi-copper enzyme maturation permease subunit
MRLALKFWGRLAIWTGILLLILLAVSLVFGGSVAEVFAHLPVWAGLALALAAFPAGIAVSSETFPEGQLVLRRVVEVALAAAAVSLLMLTLGNLVAPIASRSLASDRASATVAEPATMTLGQLHREAKEAVALARDAAGEEAIKRWRRANQLAWHFVRRTDGTMLPFLFGLIGVLVGFWSRWFPRREIQQLQQWALGLFLLVSTYLAGENSYELIVMRAVGPVFFAADLVLVVPSLLLLGMGWPTFVILWKRRMQMGSLESADY